MEQIKKIKVAMICHFSNSEVRSHLPLGSGKFYMFMRRLLGLPIKKGGYGDIAIWDTNIIKDFGNREDVDLYVVSAHSGLKKSVVSFCMEKVNYWFVRCDTATMLKHIIKSPKLWLKLNPMVSRVRKIVDSIKPDVVMLAGAENAYISSTILGVSNYPILVLCQTIYNNPERASYGAVDAKNAYVEKMIFDKEQYFAVYSKKHYDLLKQIVPDKFVFKFGWPSDGKLLEPVSCKKQYDFVNFALGMSNSKGFPDSIRALVIVKKSHPEVRMNLVGGGDENTKQELMKLAEELKVSDNIEFTPFFPKQEDLFAYIQKSRFAVLPCKMDNISGTMTQAMQLEIPMVVYKTTGTPSFNKEKRCALIADLNNIEGLAEAMVLLLDDPKLADELRRNAREYQEKNAEIAKKNGQNLLDNCKAVIDNYKNGTSIPEQQLFSSNE